MNTLLESVYKTIVSIHNTSVEVETETPAFHYYPFVLARKGHNEMIKRILNSHNSILASPTGDGKTAVYLTAIAELSVPSIIVTPRNGLQAQIEKYSDKMPKKLIALFQRTKMCALDSKAPCRKKFMQNKKWFFKHDGVVYSYPCSFCPYDKRKKAIADGLYNNKVIAVLNQGNFWFARPYAHFVVIDEADETIRSIADAVSYPEPYESDDPVETLKWMKQKVQEDIGKISVALENSKLNDVELEMLNRKLDTLENKLRKIRFFETFPPEKLITYTRGRSTYVEVFDDMFNIAKHLFPRAKICLVTATPPESNESNGWEVISTHRPFRARVIYAPIGNLSVRSVEKNGKELFEKAADFIIKTYDFITKLTGMKKAPVHCGNYARHGVEIYELLRSNGQKVLLAEEGQQAKFVQEFIENDYDFLCIVAAEYGYDWDFAPVQYILKVPFADLGDPRLKAVRKLLGEEKFNEWYNWEALSKVIQASGRNARDPQSFAVTFILDSCFERIYKKFESKIPSWFKERLIWLSGGENVEGGCGSSSCSEGDDKATLGSGSAQ